MEIQDFSHATAWLIIGALLIFLEIAVMQGIGFLFAGLGAICVGAVLTRKINKAPIINQAVA